MIRLARSLALLAALLCAVPASADQILPPGRVTGNAGSGDILFGALKFGKRQNGKTILQPDGLEIQGTGSTGDVSAMSVSPSAASAAGTLSKLIADRAPLNAPSFTGGVKVDGPVQVSGNTPSGSETLVLDVLGKGRVSGLFEATVDMASPRDTYTQHTLYSVNRGPQTASGVGQTYISFANNPNFDVAHTVIADFRVSNSANTQSKLGQFIQVGSPPMQSGAVGGAVAEWNLTNRGADTGYQASPSSPNTYGGTVPLQQVGGLNLVPEANFAGAAGVGTNVTYGVIVSRSSNLSTRLNDGAGNNDYSRTYAAFATDRDALVPSARAVGGEGGRGFSFWGGTSAALAPYGVGQAWGFWTHGLDLSRATFASKDPIRVKTGDGIVWENGSGTNVASLAVTTGGALTLTDAGGNATNVVGGPWTTYTPTYTPNGGSGVSVTSNRISYEISGKTIRLQGRIQVAHTSAPSSITLTLPSGVTLKDGSAGALVNRSAGAAGSVYGDQGGTSITLVGALSAAASGSFFFFSLTAEIA